MNSTVSTTQMAFSVGTTLLTVVIIFGLFIGMWYIVSSQLRYQRFAKIVEFLAVSLYYFCFGLIALGVALIPIVLAYFTYNYAIEGNNFLSLLDMMKWVGVAIGAYFGLSLVGYLFKKKILDKRKQRQKEVEIEEEVITQ
jgi:MFS family permease